RRGICEAREPTCKRGVAPDAVSDERGNAMKTVDSTAPPSRLSSPRAGMILVAAIALILVASLLAPRIPQDQSYHGFADQRTLLGVPNGADVLSNLAFALVGILGLA